MKNTRISGLTFVELLISVFVLTTAIVGALLFFVSAMTAVKYAKDMTIATSHANYLMEEMQSRSSLANIAGTNWVAWYANQSIATLPSETVNVVFANVSADPLDVSVSLNWRTKTRVLTEIFGTRITK